MYALVPDTVDDPARPSGGNTYDRRVIDGLRMLGWTVTERAVTGSWPRPTRADLDRLAGMLGGLPDGATVLVDGLIAATAAPALVPESARLRPVVLVHMPLDTDDERSVLRHATAVITTSRWTRDRLLGRDGPDPERVTVAEPGVDPAAPVRASGPGRRLLSVGVLAPHKGQDVLVEALLRLTDVDFTCTVVGSGELDRAFAARVRDRAAPLGGRIRFAGPLVGDALAGAYRGADLLVLPSRAETFGMVIGEALARAIPVVASDVGGVPDAVGVDLTGARPGLLVRPGDAGALAIALRRWLTEPALRADLRLAAAHRRESMTGWAATVDLVSQALDGATR